MKKSRFLTAIILAVLFVFTASALELDTAETDSAVLASDDLGELVFSVDFEGVSSITNGGVITKTSAKFGTQNVLLYSRGMNMTYGIGKPVATGTNMLSMVATDYHGCVGFQGYSLDKPGTYTLTYDRYYANSVAYQSCSINKAPSTTQSVHASAKIQNISTSLVLNEGDKAISYVQIQFAKYQSGIAGSPVYIDNVKLYYKEPGVRGTANIMFGEGDYDIYDCIPDVGEGSEIKLPSASDFAEYIPEGMFLKCFKSGNNVAAPGSNYVVTMEDAEQGTFNIYPVFASIPDAGYGELVFFEDFEGMSGAVANSSYLKNLMMGTFAGKKVQMYDRAAGCAYEIKAPVENGGNMLSVSGGNYPQISFLNLGLDKAGTYVVMFDYYLDAKTSISFMQSGINNKTARHSEIVKGETETVVLTKTISSGESVASFDIQTGFTKPEWFIDNIRIYYLANSAPAAIKANSIRTSGVNGIRFISFANNAIRASAEEYGYLVAAKDTSVSDYSTALVFAEGERTEGEATANEYGVTYIYATNFIKGSKDIVYSETGDFLPASLSMGNDGVYFTAVMTGVPETEYQTKLVVRPYAVMNGKVFYGNVVEKSLYEAALEVKNSEGYEENSFVENIINTVEKA